MAWLAAPEPRSPQPINPTRRVPLRFRAARSLSVTPGGISALPTGAEVRRKSRREAGWFDGVFMTATVVIIQAEDASAVNHQTRILNHGLHELHEFSGSV